MNTAASEKKHMIDRFQHLCEYLDSLPTSLRPSVSFHWDQQSQIGKEKGFEPITYITQVTLVKTSYPEYGSWEHIKGYGITPEASIDMALHLVKEYLDKRKAP